MGRIKSESGARRGALEAILRGRGFGPSLATERRVAPVLPGRLAGGALAELVPDGAGASGVTSTALRLAAAEPGRLAWVDPDDRLDPASAVRAGVSLDRLLWVRGAGLEAAQLLLLAGGFSLVVADLLESPEPALRLPRAAWFRLLRALERDRRCKLLLLVPRPLAARTAPAANGGSWAGTINPCADASPSPKAPTR